MMFSLMSAWTTKSLFRSWNPCFSSREWPSFSSKIHNLRRCWCGEDMSTITKSPIDFFWLHRYNHQLEWSVSMREQNRCSWLLREKRGIWRLEWRRMRLIGSWQRAKWWGMRIMIMMCLKKRVQDRSLFETRRWFVQVRYCQKKTPTVWVF